MRRLHIATETGANGAQLAKFTNLYDPAGNRNVAKVERGGHTQEQRDIYNAADEVNGATYDPAGNLEIPEGSSSHYSFDALNRLTQVTSGAGNQATTTTYQYNGDGDLAAETTGGDPTRYTLDVAGALTERLGAQTQPAHGASRAEWYVQGWGQALSSESRNQTTWYVADGLGSRRADLNQGGNIQSRYQYDPNGNLEPGPGNPGPGDLGTVGFTGEPYGADGLVYLRARWYRPADGRFVSRDPFPGVGSQPRSLQPYAYGNADPINNTDHSGRFLPLLFAGLVLLNFALDGVAWNLIEQRNEGKTQYDLVRAAGVGAEWAFNGATFLIPGGAEAQIAARVPLIGGTLAARLLTRAGMGLGLGMIGRGIHSVATNEDLVQGQLDPVGAGIDVVGSLAFPWLGGKLSSAWNKFGHGLMNRGTSSRVMRAYQSFSRVLWNNVLPRVKESYLWSAKVYPFVKTKTRQFERWIGSFLLIPHGALKGRIIESHRRIASSGPAPADPSAGGRAVDFRRGLVVQRLMQPALIIEGQIGRQLRARLPWTLVLV